MNASPDIAGVIVRPPVLVLAALAAGLAADLLWPAFGILPWPAGARYLAGGVLFVAGLALVAACFLRFRAAGTPVPTWEPTTALVTSGPYRLSRNPIYVALLLAYLGLAVGLGGWTAVALVVPVWAVLRYGVVAREERYLKAKFGDAYRDYMKRTRRWL